MAKKIKVWDGTKWEDVTPALPVALIDHTHPSPIPSQTGNSGELLVTDGTNASWSNTVTANATNVPALIVRAASGQDTQIQRWVNSSNTTLATVTADGFLTAPRITVTNTGMTPLIATSGSADIATFNSSVTGYSGKINSNAVVEATNFVTSVQTGLATTGTVDLDFATQGFKTHGSLTGNITYTASNYAAGRSVTVRVPNGATQRTLTFPTNWRFVGTKPANIAASKVGLLTVTSFGTTEADCVAAWAVEA